MTNWINTKANSLVTFKTGKLDSNAAEENGKYPFFTCAQQTYRINHYSFDTECVLLAGNNAAGIFPLKYYKGKFNAYQRTYIIEAKNKRALNIHYLYYALTPLLKEFEQSATGATTKFLTRSILDNLDILLPPLPVQKKIAAVLSAYDDLIENNNRRIAILEKTAEEIYREWFVRMRFPGHETTAFKKGVPEGWEIKPFSELVIINPTLKFDGSSKKPYIGMQDLSVNSVIFSFKEFRKGSSGSKFQNGDVLFPRITPSLENGKRGYVMNLKGCEVALGSTEFIVFRKKILPSDYIYFLTCLPEFRKHAELSMIGASGRQRVAQDCFDFFLIKTPPNELLHDFTLTVKPIFSQIKSIYNSNNLLKQTRDRLLPRLLSGKLSVENLDIKFPPGMEDTDE
jgi:type I restriction enzyme, S subunit